LNGIYLLPEIAITTHLVVHKKLVNKKKYIQDKNCFYIPH